MPFGGTTPAQDRKIDSCIAKVMPTLKGVKDPKKRKSRAIAICKSRIMKSTKGAKSFLFSTSIELKTEAGEYYIEGIASTSNPDLGYEDTNGDKVIDIVSDEALNEMASVINNGRIKLGYDHTEVLGGKPTTVPVGQLIQAKVENGKLWVKGTLNKALGIMKELKESLKRKDIDSFSIEHIPQDWEFKWIDGVKHRIIKSIKLVGMALTGRPMNPETYADFYIKHLEIKQEEHKMAEPKEEPKEEPKKEAPKEEAKEEPKEEVKTPSEETKSVSEDDYKLLTEMKALKEKESKYTEFKSLQKEYFEKELKGKNPDNLPRLDPETKFKGDEKEMPELKAWREAVFKKDEKGNNPTPIDVQYKKAADLHNALLAHGIDKRFTGDNPVSMEKFGVSGNNIQCKHIETKAVDGLNVGDNRVTSGSTYYQTSAELNDIYSPVIVSHFNSNVTTYGRLRKVDASNFADNYGFVIRTFVGDATTDTIGNRFGASATPVGPFDQGDDFTAGASTRLNCQIPFQTYGISMEVSGLLQAASRNRGGKFGDIFTEEVQAASEHLLKQINEDIYDITSPSNGMTTGGGGQILAFDYLVDDGGTNTTLYGHKRDSSTTFYFTLRGTDTAAGSTDITRTRLRTAYTTVEKNGALHSNLAIFTSFEQKDKILGFMDEAQRLSTSPRAGFEGQPMFDEVPVIADVDCPGGYLFVMDVAHTFIAVLLPPTYEDLARTEDHKKGMVKHYFALVCDAPNHNYKYTGLNT